MANLTLRVYEISSIPNSRIYVAYFNAYSNIEMRMNKQQLPDFNIYPLSIISQVILKNQPNTLKVNVGFYLKINNEQAKEKNIP